MERIIAHIDMDAFFASIEQVKKPWLKGKAIAVSGNPNGRSVIATASYEARKYGVKAGMPLSTARKFCPYLIILKGNMEEYETISENLYNLFCEFSPAVEYYSIDEVFMDLTYVAKEFEAALSLGKLIKNEVLEQFHLTCSVGISYNKLMSKIASKLCKPDGLMAITKEEAQEILKKLPVSKITGIGRKTEMLLKEKFNVEIVGELQKVQLDELVKVFHSYGKFLYNASRGIDDSSIITFVDKDDPKSVGNSITLERDTDDVLEIKAVLKMLSAKVASRLRIGKFQCRSIKLTIRYEDFYTFTHGKEIPPTSLDSDIYNISLQLFREVYNGCKVRLLGVSASLLDKSEALRLFDELQTLKEEKLVLAMDDLRQRYGYDKLEYGSINALKGDFVFQDKKISGA